MTTAPILPPGTVIEVTQKDIDDGDPGECELCAVARAVNRALPDGHFAQVMEDENYFVEIYRRSRRGIVVWEFVLPGEVCDFIETYDGSGSAFVKPFSFTVPE